MQRKRYKTKSERMYAGIAKVGYDPILKQPICVKYRFNNIEKFFSFVTKKYPVSWINIFYRKGEQKNKLAYTWGSKKGLQPAR